MKHAVRRSTLVASAALIAAATASAVTTSTSRIGVVVGPNRPYPGYYAGDIGMSTRSGDGLVTLMFGDMHTSSTDPYGLPISNDAVATFTAAGSSAAILVTPTWRGAPTVTRGSVLEMEGGRTPISIVSTTASTDPRTYGLFNRAVYAKCTADAQCGNGLKCDKLMGALFPYSSGENVVPCAESVVNPFCLNVDGDPNAGLCRDKTSSLATYVNLGLSSPSGIPVWDITDNAWRSEAGKILSVAFQHEFGRVAAGANQYTAYTTNKLITNKFAAATIRATRGAADYRSANADNAAATFWMWGRPSYYSNGAQGATSELYLAKAPNPKFTGNVMSLQYRTAAGGWSTNQANAAPLVATGGWGDGIMSFTTVTYLETAGKWVMLYGGDTPALWDALFGGPILNGMVRGNGAIKMRTATNPWGPWSAATEVLAPTSPVIASRLCQNGGTCNPFGFPEIGNGILYGAQIVEPWATSTATTATLGWFVSLWNPYQVEQLKTDITF